MTQGGRPPALTPATGTMTATVPWAAISDSAEVRHGDDLAEGINRQAVPRRISGPCGSCGTLLMSFKLTIGRVAVLGIPACHNEAIISIYPRKGISINDIWATSCHR